MTNPPLTLPRSTTTRRRFLAMAGTAAAGVTLSTMPFGGPARAAQTTGPRTLVCIFLSGGADSFNMYMPLDHDVAGQDYDTYRTTRGGFAVPATDILPVGNGDFGVHPLLPSVAALAESNRLATVVNVGPLARPTTKADYLAQKALPQNLFTHDAQRKLWQTGQSTLTSGQGWGGAVANSIGTPTGQVSPSFSIGGSNVWQSNTDTTYSRLSPTVRIQRLAGYDGSLWNWIPSLSEMEGVMASALEEAAGSTNILDQAASTTIGQSILATEALQEATADTEANEVGMEDLGRNRLALQLQQVARLIKNRSSLGMDRQVFFVRIGGWDTHGQQAERLPVLLSGLNQAIGSFQGALDGLGVADSVTTFTASDFGRTLTINGDGTDHGWGGHAFVMGGAVNPGAYGTFPSYSLENNPDDVGENSRDFAGRLIPSTAVCQHSATLARWMGMTEAEIDQTFPELGNFPTRDLGFMR